MKQQIKHEEGSTITVAYSEGKDSQPKNITGEIVGRYSDHKVLIDTVGGGHIEHFVVVHGDVDKDVRYLEGGEVLGRFVCVQNFGANQ